MSKLVRKMVLVCCLFICASVTAWAQTNPEFECQIWHENSDNSTLIFGFGTEADSVVTPFPPEGFGGGHIHFRGRVMDNDAYNPNKDYFRAAVDVRTYAPSLTWTLESTLETAQKIKFTTETPLPAGAVLMLDGQKIIFSKPEKQQFYSLEPGKNYTITYQESSSIPIAPEQPESISAEMIKSGNGTWTAQLPEGKYEIVSDPVFLNVKGAVLPDQQDSGRAKLEPGKLTYVLPAVIPPSAIAVKFAFVASQNDVQSAAATVLIALKGSGLSGELLSKNSVILEPGSKEGKDRTLVKYCIEVKDAQTTKFFLHLPMKKPVEDGKEFPYVATVSLYDDQFANPIQQLLKAQAYESTFSLPTEAGKYYLGVELKALNGAESRALELISDDGSVCLLNPQIIILSDGTLDFDGNGKIDNDDCNLLFYFVNSYGADAPENFNPDNPDNSETLNDMNAFCEPQGGLEAVKNACKYFSANVVALNFDEIGELPNNDDCNLLFYFVNSYGADAPENFDPVNPDNSDTLKDMNAFCEPQGGRVAVENACGNFVKYSKRMPVQE